jgi:DNA-binding MarR family transcriptional regulator
MADIPSFENKSNNKQGSPNSDYETDLGDDVQLDLRVWLRLLTCANLIEHRIRKNLRERFNTTLPRFDVLAQVERTPDGQPMRELSHRLMVSNGNITPLVDRLVKDNLIKRNPSHYDRRVQNVSLTRDGRNVIDEMIPAHGSWVKALMADLDRESAVSLYNLLGDLKESILTAETEQ